MITITGKPVCSGIAFGPVFVFSREESTIKRHHIESSDDEIARFESARQQTISELAMLYDKALAEVGEANAMIFQIHQMMLDDLDYIESIKNIITDQLINAETAVAQTCDNFVQMFRAMDDPYMRERSADVKDVSERLIKILSGKDKDGLVTDEPVIIISDDLAPSETVQFDKSKILAFVTEGGSTNSHTSILARMMNIPAMIGAKGVLSADANGKNAIVDGFTGTIYIDPDEATITEMTKKKEEIDKQNKLLQQLKGRESVTKDGQKIELCANIGSVLDVGNVLKNDAEGIGLFRSEFLYLESNDYPSEDVQFAAYKDVLSKMVNKRVIVRTLDIGADKQVDYFNMPKEDRYYATRSEMLDELKVLLGGRVAEALVLKEISSGASNDLQRATSLARQMICEYGMSTELGPVTFGHRQDQVFLGRDIARDKNYSEEIAAKIDKEIRKFLDEAYQKTEELLQNNIDKLHLIAQALIEKETLEGSEIEQLMKYGRILDKNEQPPDDNSGTPAVIPPDAVTVPAAEAQPQAAPQYQEVPGVVSTEEKHALN